MSGFRRLLERVGREIRPVGEPNALDESAGEETFDDVDQVLVVGVLAEDAERNPSAGNLAVAAGAPDAVERLAQAVADVDAGIRRPRGPPKLSRTR
jgi:hypothetical protein